METPSPKKPVIIFTALLFTSIVTGTIFTSRELNAKEEPPLQVQKVIPSSSPTPEAAVLPEQTPSLDNSTLPPMQKPSVNVRRDDDNEDDD